MRHTKTLLLLIATAFPGSMFAQNPQTRSGFGIGFGIGSGSAGVSCNSCSSDRTTALSGYLRLGGYLRPHVFLGAESNGWVHSEDGVDETLGFLSAVTQWYPNPATGLYLKGGLGIAAYVATDGTDEISASGGVITLGAGYDIRVGRNFSLTPYANFLKSTQGELKANDLSTGFNLSTNVLQLGLGFTWH